MAVATLNLPPDLQTACAQAQAAFETFVAGNPEVERLLGETIRTIGVTLKAAGAGLFMTERPDQPELAIEHNFAALQMLEMRDGQNKPLAGLLVAVRRAAREIKPLIVPPFFIDNESGDLPVNPSACELLFVPMKLHGKAQMILVVAVAPTADAQTHKTQINFVQRILAALEAALTRRHLALIERDRGGNARLMQFTERVHAHLLLNQVCADIANLTRDVVAGDRVTVQLSPKARRKVLAVSNVDEPNKRAMLFDAQRLILDYVRERATQITLDRAAAGSLVSDPALQDAAAAYFLATDFASFSAAPITSKDEVTGVILVEYRNADQDKSAGRLLPEIARISAAGVANAASYESIPLRRLLSAIGSIYRTPFTTRRRVIATVVGVVLLTLSLLAFVPVDFSIKADCSVQPVSQLAIVAPQPGQIIDVPVRAGEHVYPKSRTNAKPLFILDTTDLLAERSSQQQKESQLNVELKDLQEKGDISKIGGIQLQIKQVTEQIALLDYRISQASVYSPIEGTVLTENVEQKKWATVQPGEPLLDVASFKDWVLVVDVPEQEVATVRAALSHSPDGVKVDYILNPWPDRRFEIHAAGVATMLPASSQSKGANVFRLQIAINPADLPDGIAMSGVTGRAKLHVGEKPLLSQWTQGLGRLLKMTALF